MQASNQILKTIEPFRQIGIADSAINQQHNRKLPPYGKAEIYSTYMDLYRKYVQEHPICPKSGRPLDYSDDHYILFFTEMIVRRIFAFQTMNDWLASHPSEAMEMGFGDSLPDRTTLLRRFKKLSAVLPNFIAYVQHNMVNMGIKEAKSDTIFFDSSMFKAMGNVWHAKDRAEGIVPEKLRLVDRDANWGKSRYHWFLYGYKIHLCVTQHQFPVCVDITPANEADAVIFDQWEDYLAELRPKYIVGDNGYFSVSRIKRWKTRGVFLVTPATKWKNTKPAAEYHQSIQKDAPKGLLIQRKTTIEPTFDLLAKLIGAVSNHKQLSMLGIANVKSLFLLGVLALQIIMRLNLEYKSPKNQISTFLNALR